MRSISARDFGRSASVIYRAVTAGHGQARRADPALLLGIGFRHVPGFSSAAMAASARFLRRRVLRDGVERVAQHRLVVGADRADIGAAAAAGDDAGAAQDALPEIEAVLRAQQLLLLVRRPARAMMRVDVLGELREAVRRAEAVAGLPVAVPMPDRIGRAGLEAAPAARAEAQRCLHLAGRSRHRPSRGRR